jgi:hypothetical protein
MLKKKRLLNLSACQKDRLLPVRKGKTVASYNGETPEGVRREYAEDGKITSGYIFHKGNLTGEGIVNEEGDKEVHGKSITKMEPFGQRACTIKE